MRHVDPHCGQAIGSFRSRIETGMPFMGMIRDKRS
jgi:hypothetical protein